MTSKHYPGRTPVRTYFRHHKSHATMALAILTKGIASPLQVTMVLCRSSPRRRGPRPEATPAPKEVPVCSCPEDFNAGPRTVALPSTLTWWVRCIQTGRCRARIHSPMPTMSFLWHDRRLHALNATCIPAAGFVARGRRGRHGAGTAPSG